MTPQMKAFLTELSALMTKHEVEINATESTGYYPGAQGIEFFQSSKYNAETEQYTRELCVVELEHMNAIPADIDRLIRLIK